MNRALLLCAITAALATAAPASATDKFGRCLAVVDGKTRLDGPCKIELERGGGFTIRDGLDTYHVVPEKVEGKPTGTATATWSGYELPTDKSFTQTLAPMARDGACWTQARAKICARDATDEMRRNREAPSAAFHPLLGKDVLSRCHMGECEWFRYDNARLVDHNEHEALYELHESRWDIEYPEEDYKRKGKRENDETQRVYMRCSRARPAIMWRFKPGPWTIYGFAPAGSGASGASWLVNAEYAAACHAKTEVLSEAAAVLLGYPTDAAADAGDGAEIIDPTKALKPGE